MLSLKTTADLTWEKVRSQVDHSSGPLAAAENGAARAEEEGVNLVIPPSSLLCPLPCHAGSGLDRTLNAPTGRYKADLPDAQTDG